MFGGISGRSPAQRGEYVGKLMALICAMALIAVPAFARDKDREDKRLENSGRVLKEVLDIPDDIPADLLDKAECVAIFPSVLKLAIGIGGDARRRGVSRPRGGRFSQRGGPPTE